MNDSASDQHDVWDLPVRATHWSFVVLVAFLWWSGESGHMDWHQYAGFCIWVLVLARVVWGVTAGGHQRFSEFPIGMGRLKAYWQGRESFVGHNPIGAWSTLLMLALLFIQATTGLMSRDDILFEGPLAYWAGTYSGLMTDLHELNWYLLQIVVAVHILAIAYHHWRGRDLLLVMWRGRSLTRASHLAASPWVGWLAVLLISATALTLIVTSAPRAPSYF
jgi:cytochrome b